VLPSIGLLSLLLINSADQYEALGDVRANADIPTTWCCCLVWRCNDIWFIVISFKKFMSDRIIRTCCYCIIFSICCQPLIFSFHPKFLLFNSTKTLLYQSLELLSTLFLNIYQNLLLTSLTKTLLYQGLVLLSTLFLMILKKLLFFNSTKTLV